jgi:hypothetical protein
VPTAVPVGDISGTRPRAGSKNIRLSSTRANTKAQPLRRWSKVLQVAANRLHIRGWSTLQLTPCLQRLDLVKGAGLGLGPRWIELGATTAEPACERSYKSPIRGGHPHVPKPPLNFTALTSREPVRRGLLVSGFGRRALSRPRHECQ